MHQSLEPSKKELGGFAGAREETPERTKEEEKETVADDLLESEMQPVMLLESRTVAPCALA